jgi:transposase
MNQIRSLLLGRGVVVAQGRRKLAAILDEVASGATSLSPRMVALMDDLAARLRELDARIGAFDEEFAACARSDDAARRLATIPGVGAINATALAAAAGDAATCARGRDMAAWLGLVPRQATTGGRPKLLGITKRGSKYLRKMLIQGARAAMPQLAKADTRLGAWLRALLARAHPNAVVVALAAKMARTAWALLRRGGIYERAMVA